MFKLRLLKSGTTEKGFTEKKRHNMQDNFTDLVLDNQKVPGYTIDTQGNSRINLQPCLGNIFAATKTIAIIITFDPPACRRQGGQPCLTPFLARDIHGLLLHRIHA